MWENENLGNPKGLPETACRDTSTDAQLGTIETNKACI